ncbi:hypothetical protein [Paucihalobacter sp.]|uniref:hypothetical protein n=1 Tax=Paucihalobacter sp. TaxID=2850405 RepID=UPI002FE303D3
MNFLNLLPDLENPINSNFSDESFTGGPACLGVYLADKAVQTATYIADILT